MDDVRATTPGQGPHIAQTPWLADARSADGAAQASALPSHHDWRTIRVGRVCFVCKTAQATGEYDDDSPCMPTGA